MVEDLVNQSPMIDFPAWLSKQDIDWDSTLGQAGAHSGRAALPPLLSFGLNPDEHFTQTRSRAKLPLPTEGLPLLDLDLQFAAACHATNRGSLRSLRDRAVGALRELKRRWAGVSKVLRHHQPDPIRQVTVQRDLGLVSLLVVITSWADTGYPFGLIQGLPAVGFAPHYGIFPALSVEPTTFTEVLGDWQTHNSFILRQLHPGKDDQFLLQQSIADAEQSFCSFPMRRTDLLKFIQNAPDRLIPRCVITQSSGKQRVIDNADVGGQSESSRESNKLVLCSPFRPAQQIALTLSLMTPDALATAKVSDTWQTGGEDWPNAYRHSPMNPHEALGCVVTFWHHEWGRPAYQVYTGLLFGLPLAVTSFNRYSRLAEALGRRLTFSLVSLYFDDATVVDWASSKGSAQWAFGELNKLLGTPFAADKRQLMATAGTFLGLHHDFEHCMTKGVVTFWVREKLQTKITDLIHQSLSTQSLSPGVASKLYGMANFFEMGVYGRVGCGGLAAIKARQYERTTIVTPAIHTCFEVLRAVIRSQPRREFEVLPHKHARFCAASDAALEVPRAGSGGFLLVWFGPSHELREGFVADIPPGVYEMWTPGDRKIAQLELLMVLYALTARPGAFRDRRGVWMIDNIAALMSLIRGRSDSPDLEHMSHMIHTILYALRCWMWWEYVPSKSNWADAISRLGAVDPWHVSNGFSTSTVKLPLFLWQLPFAALVALFEFL